MALVAALALLVSTCVVVPLAARAEDPVYADGVYTIEGTVLQANEDVASMSDSTFERPLRVYAKGGKLTLHATLLPVDVSGLKGYLGHLKYYPGYMGSQAPKSARAEDAHVVSSYDVEDSFNALTSTDAKMNGKRYPHVVEFPVDASVEELWLQIYVPLMEGLSAGNGTQYTRLHLDFDTMTPCTTLSARCRKATTRRWAS